jgi:hypothetical protein
MTKKIKWTRVIGNLKGYHIQQKEIVLHVCQAWNVCYAIRNWPIKTILTQKSDYEEERKKTWEGYIIITLFIRREHWLSNTYNSCSLERLPREAGISPAKRLSSKSKLVKLERLPNSSGMLPVILLPASDLKDHMLHSFIVVREKD